MCDDICNICRPRQNDKTRVSMFLINPVNYENYNSLVSVVKIHTYTADFVRIIQIVSCIARTGVSSSTVNTFLSTIVNACALVHLCNGITNEFRKHH